jgi:hypothetical protein
MSQIGHWMMGHAKVGGHDFGLSGGFGNDGLPNGWRCRTRLEPVPGGKVGLWGYRDLTPDEVKRLKADFLTVMPDALSTSYWTSAGHNEVGPASTRIKAWAVGSLEQLRRRPKRVRQRRKKPAQ